MFLDALWFGGQLAVRPTEDPPALVDEAVLPEKAVLELFDSDGIGMVPRQAVDLKGNMLVQRTQGIIDEAAIAIDVFDGILMREQLHLVDTEHLGEQLDELIFRKAAVRLPFAGWHWFHDKIRSLQQRCRPLYHSND